MSTELPTRLSEVPPPDPVKDDRLLLTTSDGQQVQVLATLRRPRIIVFGGVLTRAECDELIELSRAKLSRSEVVADDAGVAPHEERTSEGTDFVDSVHPLILKLDARLEELLGWPKGSSEELQILHYRPGAEYKPHYDFFDETKPSFEEHTAKGGNRVATLILYLQNSEVGGTTVFPNLGLEFAPPRGGGVFFSYSQHDAAAAAATLHGGTPVRSGEKWIATRWLREKPYR